MDKTQPTDGQIRNKGRLNIVAKNDEQICKVLQILVGGQGNDTLDESDLYLHTPHGTFLITASK